MRLTHFTARATRCAGGKSKQELLHWTPKVPLQEGLRRTIAYFEDWLSRSRDPVRRMEIARAG